MTAGILMYRQQTFAT